MTSSIVEGWHLVPLGEVIEFQQRARFGGPPTEHACLIDGAQTVLTIEPCPVADEISSCCCSEPESRAR